ncbi:beta-eliminating lyase-related protein, partial [Salmonella enterica subsp. enterica serovar Montevideo]|nr:beta-eliminating lyase-related protein [Salmonella enterica subsp. enterica serovar Montevideo]
GHSTGNGFHSLSVFPLFLLRARGQQYSDSGGQPGRRYDFAPYIKRATRWRKMVGGGMRQAGILAAAGLYALKHNVARLQEDHDNAAWLAQQLREAGAEVMRHETNMLFVRVGEAQAAALGDYLRERNILINAAPIVRLVTHLDVSREQLADVVAHWRAFLAR